MPLNLPRAFAKLWLLSGLFIVLFLLASQAQATHIRAGNIFAKSDTVANPNPLRFYFKLVTYTVAPSPPAFEDVETTLYFGDCTSQTAQRALQVELPGQTLPGQTLPGQGNYRTYVNVYYFSHTYGGAGTYTTTWVGENRNAGIVNMSNSVSQTFLLQSIVTIDPFLGVNRSPVLEIPPIDVAARNQIFVHNPGAYDPDGDSLSFKLLPSRVGGGQNSCGDPIPQTAPGFTTLDNFLGTPVDAPAPFFSLDRNSGQLTWNSPGRTGEYNVAFIVEEWRDGRLIGSVIRDMQIFVLESQNRPPELIVPRDTCVIAGTLVRDTIKARDPDKNPIIITAFSEIFSRLTNPATFRQTSDTTGIFNWQTTCNDVRQAPYQITFRAQDQPPTGIKLVDLQPWRITVVGPPPVLTTAIPQSSNSIQLNWSAYTCANASRIYIYRKEGPSDFVPGPCETGIPASAGYTLVGDVPAGQTNYLDNNGGQGLERNKTYCYRIYAEFPAPGGGSSIASNEVCASLESISMTKVSVLQTSATAGRMQVEWSRPRAIVTQLTAPFRYRLLRTEGQNRVAATFTEVYSSTNLNDTTFIDQNLNTLDTAYTYRVEFFHSGNAGSPTILVDSSSATSVRLNARANGTTLELNWTYNVPWNNASTTANPLYHVIYLQSPGTDFIKYDSVLATTSSGTYSKVIPLAPGQDYCAFVVTKGTFQNPVLPNPVLNNSQQACVVNVCQPILTVNECDEDLVPANPPYQNVLTWTLPPGCLTSSIATYTIYYKPTVEAAFEVLATVPGTQMSYTHNIPIRSFAGCYVVTATDVNGNTSVYTQEDVVCKDNCINFSLPNIFTPNGDGVNDVFTPKRGAAFIRTATLRMFNRWGTKVFEGNADPAINWSGVDNGGTALSDGTYFYQVEIEFYGLSATPQKTIYKGWVEIIH